MISRSLSSFRPTPAGPTSTIGRYDLVETGDGISATTWYGGKNGGWIVDEAAKEEREIFCQSFEVESNLLFAVRFSNVLLHLDDFYDESLLW